MILDKLGQGGMGMVLKAEHRRMERVVALKILSPNVTKTSEMLARFEREVKAAARLEHPNIVTAYDADEAGGTHFLVMQYVDGTDLSARVRENGPLSVEQGVSCILQAARGLKYAHAHGVVHRDIKPANLLLDSSGTVKILDMGLARLESAGADQDQLTGTGQIMGTVDYMAPKQALDTKHADSRADIYSLGVTLWYLLTARAVYEGDSVMAKLLAHRDRAIPSLRQACPQVSPTLEAVFARMVAKTPEARYQTMADVIADLERCQTAIAPAPSDAKPSGEDTRLHEFLQGLQLKGAPFVATKTAPLKTITSSGLEPTVSLQSPQVDTDPETQQSLVSPVAGRRMVKSKRRSASRLSRSQSIAIGGGALFLLLATIVFFVQTKDGLIRVQIDDPQIEVTIKGTEIVLKQADQGKDVKLSPGDHTLVVQRGDFTFETSKLVLKKGETVTVQVELLAGQVTVHQGEKLIGQGKLPSLLPDRPKDGPVPAIAPFDAKQARRHQESWAKHLGTTVETTNSVGMRMTLIPPGEFLMGSTDEQVEAALNVAEEIKAPQFTKDSIRKEERPQHRVVITKPFLIGTTEVTIGQFRKFVGAAKYVTEAELYGFGNSNSSVKVVDATEDQKLQNWRAPGFAVTDESPVAQITWNDALAYCNWLSAQEKTIYRLPTEAEWEYACRAGTTTQYSFGDDVTLLEKSAWYGETVGAKSHPIGTKTPNGFGLRDMHGNLYEWCQDFFDEKWYEKNSPNDPKVPVSGAYRVYRGGSWFSNASQHRSAYRNRNTPSLRYANIGFRCVRVW